MPGSYTNESLGFSKSSTGGHSARSMMVVEMKMLFRELPALASKDDFIRAVVEENVLEKPTLSSRKKSMRHLVELYGMDPTKLLFRVLWSFGHSDPDSIPHLCLVCSFARDPQLRNSFELVRTLRVGEVLERVAMEQQIETGFPGRFSPAMKKSMAQNVNTTWTYSGHLVGKVSKARRLPEPRPISAAYAMFVGYLSGLRGEKLLGSVFAELVSSNRSQLLISLSLASAKGLLSLKQAAGVVEFDFSNLLSAQDEALIHESN